MTLPPHFLGDIIDTSELIANRPKFAAGLGRSSNPEWTGIPSFAELMSQVFDDLQAREAVIAFVDEVAVPASLRAAVPIFVAALSYYGETAKSDDVSFASSEWRFVEASARAVIGQACEFNYSGTQAITRSTGRSE